MIYNSQSGESELEQLMDLFQAMNTEDDDKNNWTIHREIFSSMSASIHLDFTEDAKKQKIPF